MVCRGLAQRGEAWHAQNPNPLLKMPAEAPKVRTLCLKWQPECPKFEPFAQNGKLDPEIY